VSSSGGHPVFLVLFISQRWLNGLVLVAEVKVSSG
jgi:hypothetical protein